MLAFLVFSSTALATSLTDTLRAALAAHPAVQAAGAEAESASQVERVARAGHYPSLDLRLAGGREDTRYEAPAAAGPVVREVDMDREEASLTLRQVLFNGFGTSAAVSQRQAEAEAALARLDLQRQRVALEAGQAHLDVVAARQALEAAGAQVVAHERALGQVRSRLEQGVGQRVDVSQAESRLARARQVLLQRRQAVLRAQEKYRRLTGVEPGPDLNDVPLATGDIEAEADVMLQRAQQDRPEAREAAARLEAAGAQLRSASAGNYPEIALELSGNRVRNLDGVEALNEDTTAMATLRYNLFRGGADLARRRAAASAVVAARERQRETQWQLREELAVARGALEQAEASVPQATERARAIASVAESYEAQFNLGRRSLLDVLDAVSEAHEAQLALIQARRDRELACLQWWVATGRLAALLSVGLQSDLPSDLLRETEESP